MKPSGLLNRHATSDRRGAWWRRVKGAAASAVLFTTIAASSVVAASEALHDTPGDAVRVLCDAFVHPSGTKTPVRDADEANAESGLQ